MDTILYFYKKEEQSGQLSRIQPAEYRLSDYMLVQVGLNAGQVRLLSGEEEPGEKRRETPWRRRARKKAAAKERQELLAHIEALWGPPCGTWCVCEPPLELFPGWAFTDYREEKWVERLMDYAVSPHYVVLGNADCLPYVLPRYARHMKSLSFVLCEADVTEELEELLEELLLEYGIAATIRQLQERADYRRLQTLSLFPCNVLDFSGEEKIFPSIVPEGSVWLDFNADWEKWRRMELLGSKIQYVSLKKEWKQLQKGRLCLDTTAKNRYNTKVNGKKIEESSRRILNEIEE